MRTVATLLAVALSFGVCAQDARGVRLVPTSPEKAGKFDRRESAALFVGIRDFEDPQLGGVKYTVDDAVDLAYVMAFEQKVRLVPPSRVVIAISGEPVKAESKARLTRLLAEGATQTTVDRETLVRLIDQQTRAAGRNGVLILFFATHGFSSEGTAYLLASDSRFEDPATSLSATRIVDIAASSPARRSLLFLDACRERVPTGTRGPYFDEQGTAPMIEAMTPQEGQVIFFAARPGGYAHEQPHNGVFTSAVIDGLACRAQTSRGLVTVETLARYADGRVGAWIRRNRDPAVRKAIQVLMDVDTKSMPLAVCTKPPNVAAVNFSGPSLTTFDQDGDELWSRKLDGDITVAEPVDLDDDGTKEVIAGTADGNLLVFSGDGEQAWSDKTGPGAAVRTFTTAWLGAKRDHRHIITLSNGSPSFVNIFTSDGTQIGRYAHAGELRKVVVDRFTARHQARVFVAASETLFMLDTEAALLWSGTLLPPGQTIESLTTVDYDNDGDRDVKLTTSAGTLHLTFAGEVLHSDGVQFQRTAVK